MHPRLDNVRLLSAAALLGGTSEATREPTPEADREADEKLAREMEARRQREQEQRRELETWLLKAGFYTTAHLPSPSYFSGKESRRRSKRAQRVKERGWR